MPDFLLKNVTIVNEGKTFAGDCLITRGRIEKIASSIDPPFTLREIDGEGLHLFPGIIDDQVHFREPGLTHKAEIYTEAKAAVAGGVTSYMEMPNTKPPALTQELLEDKYNIAAQRSLANYSFYMGASNDNLEEVLKTDPAKVCGVKAFMGSSTGNMLVDDPVTLEKLFAECPMLIATHCEDEATVKANTQTYRDKYGEDIPIACHPEIRDENACYLSSSLAVAMARKSGTRLHILHLTTAKELSLFSNELALENKRITSEVCVHHLRFDKHDYDTYLTQIKCNPAVKSTQDREALWEALLDDRLDVVATDHAPHTWAEKQNKYLQAPSGIPLIQHSLNLMLEFHRQGRISLEKLVEKMCHAPAVCFRLKNRGYIREGYAADLVLVDLDRPWTVNKSNIHYKCGWSPFEDHQFQSSVTHTFVNGHLVYENGHFDESQKGQRLEFH